MKKINLIFFGLIFCLNHANSQVVYGKKLFYNSKKINEKIKLEDGILKTISGTPYEGTLIIDSVTWGNGEKHGFGPYGLIKRVWYINVPDKFSSPIKFKVANGMISKTERDSYFYDGSFSRGVYNSQDTYTINNDGFGLIRKGNFYNYNLYTEVKFDVFSEVRNGDLSKVISHSGSESISKEFKNNKLISLISSDNTKKIILNDSITKIIEYNFEEGNNNKTEVQSIHFFKNNELVQLEKYSDGKLTKQFIYDNGYLVSSKEITKNGYIIETYSDGVLLKTNRNEFVDYYYNWRNIEDTNNYLFTYRNGQLDSFSCINNEIQIKVTPELYEVDSMNNTKLSDILSKMIKQEEQWTIEYHIVNGIISGRYIRYLTTNPTIIQRDCNYVNGVLEGSFIERQFDSKFKLLKESSGQMKNFEPIGNWTVTLFNNGKKKVTTSTY
ncbi:MAG: hypothetical protein ACKO7P_06270 [Bacteroidota bacterium]